MVEAALNVLLFGVIAAPVVVLVWAAACLFVDWRIARRDARRGGKVEACRGGLRIDFGGGRVNYHNCRFRRDEN